MDRRSSVANEPTKPVHCITQIESVVPQTAKASAQRDYVHLDNSAVFLDPSGGDLTLLTAAEFVERNDDGETEMRNINVHRRVLTQKSFDELHEPTPATPPTPKRFFQAIGRQFMCTRKEAKKRAYNMVPLIEAMRNYDVKNWLLVDAICGITIGIITVPQSMGYALLASVPPVYGLYSSFLPVLLYCFFGTSRHMCYGTLAITYLLVGNAIVRATTAILGATASTTAATAAATTATTLAATTSGGFSAFTSTDVSSAAATTAASSAASLQAATNASVGVCLAFLMGLIQLGIGIFRLGFVTIYFADSMVAGYTTATICYVLTSQLASLFGLTFARQTGYCNLIRTWIMVFSNIASTNVATLIVSLCCIASLSVFKFWINPKVMKKIRAPIPIELLVIIAAIVASTYLNLHGNYKVAIVGQIPDGIPVPTVPDMSVASYVIGDAIIIAFVNFAVSVSLAQVLSKKHGYEIDENQEAIAYGISNFIPSFFHAIPTGGSVARTCVEESIQGKSQIVNVISSLLTLIVLYTVAGLFQQLPISALASIIVVGLSGMIDQFKNVSNLWKISKFDAAIWIVSFGGTVLLDTDIGLIIAILFSFLVVVVRTQATKRGLLGNVAETDLYEDVKRYKDAQQEDHIKIFRFAGAINFACATMFRSAIYKKTGVNPRRLQIERNKLDQKKKRANKKMKSESDPDKCAKYQETIARVQQVSSVQYIVIELSACSYIDYGGLRILKQVIQEYKAIGVTVFIAGCTETVRNTLKKTDFYAVNDASIVFVSVHDAVTAAKLLIKNPPVDAVTAIATGTGTGTEDGPTSSDGTRFATVSEGSTNGEANSNGSASQQSDVKLSSTAFIPTSKFAPSLASSSSSASSSGSDNKALDT